MVPMSRRGRPLLSWQLGCSVPEKVPEKTPGAWFTKLSMTAPGFRDRGVGLLPGVDVALLLAGGEQSICSGQVVEAAWDRKEPAVTGEGDTGEEGLLDTGGTRAALDTGLQGEDTGAATLESPRAAAAAAAAAASTWRCWSGACWAASCNCTNIM